MFSDVFSMSRYQDSGLVALVSQVGVVERRTEVMNTTSLVSIFELHPFSSGLQLLDPS